MPTLDLTMEQVSALRDLFTSAGCPPVLRTLDHRLGRLLGCDPYVLYQDILSGASGSPLVRDDGTLDLNAAEAELARFGEHDLNLAERVLADERDRRRERR